MGPRGGSGKISISPFGGSSIGRTTDSESVRWRFESSPPSCGTREGPVEVPSSRGLGHHPLKVEARVRIPLGLLKDSPASAGLSFLPDHR